VIDILRTSLPEQHRLCTIKEGTQNWHGTKREGQLGKTQGKIEYHHWHTGLAWR